MADHLPRLVSTRPSSGPGDRGVRSQWPDERLARLTLRILGVRIGNRPEVSRLVGLTLDSRVNRICVAKRPWLDDRLTRLCVTIGTVLQSLRGQ